MKRDLIFKERTMTTESDDKDNIDTPQEDWQPVGIEVLEES